MLGISTENEHVTGLKYLSSDSSPKAPDNSLSNEVVRQLKAYFAESDFQFDLPIELKGTDFQSRVWQSLRKIPVGQVKSYGELAADLKTGARAVGNACRQNPIPVIVPCHRVISASGIGGYAGHTGGEVLDRKYWLLRHENVQFA